MGVVNQSVVKNTALGSVIGESSILAPRGERHVRDMHAELLLTALIDAFSILVIFLLMSFSSSGEIIVPGKGVELPKAMLVDQLDRQPVVKIENGKIYVEDRETTVQGLVASLLDVRKKFSETRPGEEFPGVITIQGDRRLKYEVLNSIVLASSQAGFSDIKFAVITK